MTKIIPSHLMWYRPGHDVVTKRSSRGEDALPPAVVRVDLGLHGRPVVEDHRALAWRRLRRLVVALRRAQHGGAAARDVRVHLAATPMAKAVDGDG